MSAIVTVATTSGIDSSNDNLYGFLANISTLTNKTSMGFTGVDAADGINLFFTGTAFTFNGNKFTGGSITGLTIDNGSTVLTETFSPGLSAAAVQSAATTYFNSGYTNHTALDGVFKSIAYSFTGNIGNDTFAGGKLADVLNGNDGDDFLAGLAGADTIDGGANGMGGDSVDYSASAAGVTVTLGAAGAQTIGIGGDAAGDKISNIENIFGSAFADVLTGNELDNSIHAGGGNDIVEGGSGADHLDGGAGVNTLSYAHDIAGVQINFNLMDGMFAQGGNNDGAGDTLQNFQNFIGGSGNDGVTDMDGQANKIDGGLGDDYISDHGGDDILIGGGNGVAGDTLSYAQAVLGVTVNLAITSAQVTGIGKQTISGFEKLVGSALDDKLTGDQFANKIDGGTGDDIIEGGGGGDQLIGGASASSDPVGDTLSYAHSAQAVSVDLLAQQFSGGDATGDTATGFENLLGSTHNDVLKGDAGDNIVEGGAGDDDLYGNGAGANGDTLSYEHAAAGVTVTLGLVGTRQNTIGAGKDLLGDTFANLTGSAFNDVLTGDGADNVIKGLGGNNVMFGGGGADTIIGGAGNDVIEGGAGADKLEGGAGINTLSYAHDVSGVSVDLQLAHSSGGDAAGDSFKYGTFQTLVGGSGNDKLTGDVLKDKIDGGSGDDLIDASYGGDDILIGGANGANGDTLSYAIGASVGVTVSLAIVGMQNTGVGKQTISGFENLTGTSSDDVLKGDKFANTIDGGTNGHDFLEGGGGGDKLIGGNHGYASYAGSAAAVNINLQTGAASGGDATGDILVGIVGVVGSKFADHLTGLNTVNTFFMGGGGGDIITGGTGGFDEASYQTSAAGVTVDLNLTTAQLGGGDAKGDILSGIELLIGSKFDDNLRGDANYNILVGGVGNDILEGGANGDVLDGGIGINTLSYKHDTAGVSVDLTAMKFSGGDAQGDAIVAGTFQNIIGGSGNDSLIGNSADNRIDGGAGDDVIAGGLGKNILIGGTGGEVLGDTLDDSAAVVGVTINLGITTSQKTGSSFETIIGFENVTGSSHDDILIGTAAKNTILGGAGDDFILGGAGTDHLDGGANGAGGDTVSYATAAQGVTVNLQFGFVFGGDSDSILNFENVIGTAKADTLIGDGGDNVIEGGAGADTLGGGGNGMFGDTVSYAHSAAGVTINLGLATAQLGAGDGKGDTISGFENILGSKLADHLTGDGSANVLTGSIGADILTGGAGADKFVFNSLAERGDHITDFVSGTDLLQFNHGGFANTTAGMLNFAHGANPVAGSAGAGWFLYDDVGGKLYFDDDGTGAHAKVLVLTLDHVANVTPMLTSADILLV